MKTNKKELSEFLHALWQQIEEKLKRPGYQLLFVVFCVIISRLLICLTFFLWRTHTGQEITFFEAFSRFDTSWYRSIITEGYSLEPNAGDKMDSANWAFFPLMPVIMRLIHFVIPINWDLLAFFVSSLFFAAALFIAFRYILQFHEKVEQAVIFTLLMSFGVYNFYFSLLYTEALFFFFVVLFFYAMRNKKYILMGIAGALASATRTIGIMLVFAIAVQYTVEFIQNRDCRRTHIFAIIKNYITGFLGNIRLVIGTVLVPAGLFAYMLYLRIRTGDAMAFVHIQIAWGKREVSNPVKILLDSLTNVDSAVFYLSLWALFGIYCIWVLLKKKHWSEAAVCTLFVMIPLSTSMIAMPRYLIGCFLPLLGFTEDVADWSLDKKVILMAGSFLFNFVCLIGWFNSAGYVM